MDINKNMIIDEISKEFIYVMRRDETKSEILKLYEQTTDTRKIAFVDF